MILSYLENNRLVRQEVGDVRFEKNCEVLCIGAGSAGIYAADAAASEGADVILLEADDNIGGMHVCGSVAGYYYGAVGGSYQEDDALCAADTVFFKSGRYPDAKQMHLFERLNKAGVRLLCAHTPLGVYFDGSRAVGLRVFDGERETIFGFSLLIDATSDGHILRMCPVKKQYGRVSDGKTVPFTARTQFIKDGVYRFVNTDSGFVNQYDARELSHKIVCAHANTISHLHRGEFLGIASHTGIREGLTFEGEDTLHYADILLDRPPEKVLFYAYSDLDKHGHDHALDDELFQNWWVISNLSTVTANIPIPFGCVVPKGISGIVTAGRCLSCDSYAQSAVRMNRDMFRMGECVGVAAAMAVRSQKNVLEIDYDTYVQKVRARHCFGGTEKSKFGFDYPGKNKPYRPVTFDIEKTMPFLDTQTPGTAIWSCYVSKNPRQTADAVYDKLCAAESPLTRRNCALALGIMGDARALPVLRETVANRDCFYYTDCRRSNQFAGVMATCLLGRIGQVCDAALLESIVFDPAEIERPLYHMLKPDYLYYANSDRNFVYFDYFTHAAVGLVKLCKRHGMDLSALHTRFASLFADESVFRRVTDAAPDEPAYLEISNVARYLLRQTEQPPKA